MDFKDQADREGYDSACIYCENPVFGTDKLKPLCDPLVKCPFRGFDISGVLEKGMAK